MACEKEPDPCHVANSVPSSSVRSSKNISKPAGAYTTNPALEGEAVFGFVARYKKGADIPSGNTEFSFRIADLEFRSGEYDWLVVAGAKAQFKGRGTINEAGSYGFMLTALDGDLRPTPQADAFRIKIWGLVTEDVVYDNRLGQPDDSDAATDLGEGSIVIHGGDKGHAASPAGGATITGSSALPTAAGAQVVFTLSADANVSVAVVNIAGRVVRRVCTDKVVTAGANTILWNATSDTGTRVPSGRYLVRILARSDDGQHSQSIVPLMVRR